MLTLRLLGGIALSDNQGRDMDALLGQSKRVALLAYLAMPRPGTWHRRDQLLNVFWPEHDEARSRSALRSALYTLRGHLPAGAISTRGDDEVCLSPLIITTDVAGMSDDLAAGRFAEALARYQGELLPSIYVAESHGFDEWLDQERRRARTIAGEAAARLSGALEKKNELKGAIDAARRAAEIDPDDEAAARRWIALLDRAGDRAQAFAVYERVRNHMSAAFGVRPSAETVALLDAVRTRHNASPAVVAMSAQVDRLQTVLDPTPESSATAISHADPFPARDNSSNQRSRQWWWLAAPVFLAALIWTGLRPQQEAAATSTARSLVVLPMVNETGDPQLAYVATGIAEDVARRLEGIGGIRIRSGARSEVPTATRRDIETIGRELGSTILLRTSLRKAGDSLELHASVVDATTSEERPLVTHRFSMSGIRDEESWLAADVAGAVFRRGVPVMPRTSERTVDPESSRLTLEGWHQLLSNIQTSPVFGSGKPGLQSPTPSTRAIEVFTKAVDIDPLNARAWAGLSSAIASQTVSGSVPFEEGYDQASAAAMHALALDSLQSTALANLAVMRALKYRDFAAGAQLMRKAEVADPSNPEIFLIKATMFRFAHAYDQARDAIRLARRLDPLTPYYRQYEANIELCTDHPEVALQLNESGLRMNPSDRVARLGLTRSLAMLGRYDDAIDSWRTGAQLSGNTALVRALKSAHGASGYWKQVHAEGRARLAAIKRGTGRVLPTALIQAEFAAGDADAAFNDLDKIPESENRTFYRMACMRDIDEFRHTPRFAVAEARIGGLRIH